MVSKVITYNFNEDFIDCLVNYIQKEFISKSKYDLSKLAVIFGGKRPSLFVKRQLSVSIDKSFYPPKFFSIDEFINYIVKKQKNVLPINDLNVCYILYNLTKKIAPEVLSGREKFSEFLPWAKELARFIDELDLEIIDSEALKSIQYNAEIGYEIPENVNKLLEHIISIRQAYHKKLKDNNTYPRSLKYNTAANLISNIEFPEFDKILFCNFFYLSKSEEKIIKSLYDRDKTILFFQRDDRIWPVFEKLSDNLSCKIKPDRKIEHKPNIEIQRGFDIHSQIGLVRKYLKKKDNFDETVIVLPDSNSLIPLLSEISVFIDDFNVSMGYPLNRTTLYSLFQAIFKSQSTCRDNMYYTKDYLKVLTHPFMKNLAIINSNSSITRVLVHKIEELLKGVEKTNLSGNLFIKLSNIQQYEKLYSLVISTLKNMHIDVNVSDLKTVVEKLHFFGFNLWSKIKNFSDLSKSLDEFLNILIDKSFIGFYPLNLKILEKIFSIKDKLQNALFNHEEFDLNDIFKIFDDKLANELVSFYGSPLKGLQILGLFETRALSFKNVIVMNVNESVLPKLKVSEPLIPRQIMISLGLDRLEQAEEIQRYHFMRLISSAENVYLVYNDNPENIRSRFIEELIWDKQVHEQKLSVFSEPQAKFKTEVLSHKSTIQKTPKMIEVLRKLTYSPSSIDTYLNCPLRFYYQYVLKLKETEEMLEEPKGSDMGSFIHELLEEAFSEFVGSKPVIDENFKGKFLKLFDKKFDVIMKKRMKAEAFMVKDVLEYRLTKFLDKEKTREVEEIVSLEDSSLGSNIELSGNKFDFKCIIDRLDKLENGSFLIIDYKTGTSAKAPKGIKSLNNMEFNRESIKKTIRSFQLPLYYYFVRKNYKEASLNAVLYNLKTLDFTAFVKNIKYADDVMQKCIQALDCIVQEILDVDKDFEADESKPQNCKYCPFFYLCR